MAGRTSASTAAIGFDAGNVVVAGAFHDGHTVCDLNFMLGAVVFNICDLRHLPFRPYPLLRADI